MEFLILGGGRWGTALAKHIGSLGHRALVYDRNPNVVQTLQEGKNPYVEGDTLENVSATTDLEKAQGFSPYVIIALPVQVIREVLAQMDLKGKVIISASKGLEVSSFKRVSQIVKELHKDVRVLCLSGPSFAVEVMKGLPTALVLAGEDLQTMREVRELLSSPTFRVYLSDDLTGVELGGALKNVIAIACGISDGLGLGNNARAGLLTRGLAEMVRIGLRLGARRETFYGLSGMGDLFLTASSELSRNRSFGYLIGKGMSVEDALKTLGQTVEGLETVKAVVGLSKALGIHAPISHAVYRVLLLSESPSEVARELLLRPPQSEFESL